jgi:exosortase A
LTVPTITAPSDHSALRRAAITAAIAALLLFGLLQKDTVVFLGQLWWNHQAYGHGLLLIPVGIYLLWVSRKELATLQWGPSWLGAIFLCGVAFVSWLGAISGINVLSQTAIAAAPLGVVWTLFGTAVVRAAVFPLTCMFLVVPFWEMLVSPLQDVTTAASTYLLRLIGVPVYVEGNYMTIPKGQFSIERVCAGLRYLLAMVSIASMYAYMHLRGVRRSLTFIATSIGLSIVFNWIRVTGIIFAGHITDMQTSLVHDHEMFGWVLFVIALLPLLWLGGRMADAGAAKKEGDTANEPSFAAPTTAKLVVAVVTVSVLVSVPTGATWWVAQQSATATSLQFAKITDVPGWDGPLRANPDWQPQYLGADARYEASFEHADQKADIRIAYFAHNVEGSELVTYRHADFRSDQWTVVREFRRQVPNGGPPVAETLVRSAKNAEVQRLIWRWYVVGTRMTASPEKAKIYGLWGRLTGKPSGAIVSISAAGRNQSPDLLRTRLTEFTNAVLVDVTARLVALDGEP